MEKVTQSISKNRPQERQGDKGNNLYDWQKWQVFILKMKNEYIFSHVIEKNLRINFFEF